MSRLLLASAALGLSAATLAACTPAAAVRPDAVGSPSNPVVATWARETLTRRAFETEYARQNGGREAAADDSLARMQDFLQRYVDFRLKVREAERLGYERTPSVRDELARYRAEYATPYLMDKEVLAPIVRELYDRGATMVDASHILVQVPRGASPEDTLRARARLQTIVDSLRQGVAFGDLARRNSEDPSARGPEGQPGAAGRLGYFSSGDMVDAFEDAAFATPVGQVSPILRTPFGYHVLYVHDKKAAPGSVRVAHIMLAPEDGRPESKARARARADSLKARLAAGDDFAALAQRFSTDQGSAPRGGDLGTITYNDIPVEPFRTVAFGLAPGQTSDVVETQFGYHLIRVAERVPRPTLEEATQELRARAARTPRAAALRTAMLARLAREHGARVDTAAVARALALAPLDSVRSALARSRYAPSDLARSVVFVGDSTYTLQQVLVFGSQTGFGPLVPGRHAAVRAATQRFVDEAVLRHAALALPQRDSTFGRLMADFRNGTLLFKLMEDSVWTKAQTDTLALRARYDARRATLAPVPARSRVLVFASPDAAALAALAGRVRQSGVAALAAAPPEGVSVDTLFLAGPSNTPLDAVLGQPIGQPTAPVAYRGPLQAVLVRVAEEPARPKTFEEAKPELAQAYQAELEAALVARLRRAANVRLHPERLRGAFGRLQP